MATIEAELKTLMVASLVGDEPAHRALLARLSGHLRAYFKGRLARIGRSAAEAEDLDKPRQQSCADHLLERLAVARDPTCGCCSGWVQHLQKTGFDTKVLDTRELDAVKKRLGVPDDLAACHTAEVAGYVIEGHVPAAALTRLLAEKPNATGLAVPGMPIGSPGMEGGRPEKYDVILFGAKGQQTFMSFVGEQSV